MKETYQKIIKKNPTLSSLVCYAKLIKTGKYSPQQITRGFNWVDKDDYLKSQKSDILKWLSKAV